MLKSSKRISLIIIIVAGLILSGSLFMIFVGNTTEVLVATQDVKANTKIKESMFTIERVDTASLPDNYLSADSAKDVVGYYTYIGFTKGSVISKSNIATSAKKASGAIEKGKTLLTISAENLPTGIQSGDKVNIIIGANTDSGNKVVLTYQNIDVSNIYVDDEGSITGLEVSVTPEQSQKIVYAKLNGELSISLLPINYKDINLPIIDEGGFLDTSSSSTATDTNTSEAQ